MNLLQLIPVAVYLIICWAVMRQLKGRDPMDRRTYLLDARKHYRQLQAMEARGITTKNYIKYLELLAKYNYEADALGKEHYQVKEGVLAK